jgi:flagellar basal-body rod protein FlgB
VLHAIDDHLSVRLAALDLRAKRMEVLSSNIANADTPNYKARDFDFAQALRGAIAGATPQTVAMVRTDASHLSGRAPSGLPVALEYRVPVQPSIDGNTVEMDRELGQFSDNALRYQASLTFLNQRIANLRMAIAGQ